MKLPEGQFVIQVQGDEQLAAVPAFSGDHARRVPGSGEQEKKENACGYKQTWPGILADIWLEPDHPNPSPSQSSASGIPARMPATRDRLLLSRLLLLAMWEMPPTKLACICFGSGWVKRSLHW
jgi:hypothetical protein